MKNKGNPQELVLPEVSHLGYVTRHMERSIENLRKYCGLEFSERRVPEYFNKRYRGEPEDFKIELAFAQVGNTVYELIRVVQGRTVYEDFLNKHGEGIHHLGYETPDLTGWAEAYKEVGIEVIMCGERAGVKWAYFDTPVITVELLERTDD